MIIYSFTLLIPFLFCIFLFELSGIKYHVKYYTKLYSRLLNLKKKEKDAMLYLLLFYLRDEPEWKCNYMRGRLNEYFKSFDRFILDTTLFHYNVHPWQQNWQTDIFNNKISIENIMNKVQNYLNIYKKKYLKNYCTKPTKLDYIDSYFKFEIKENINRLIGKLYEIESISESSCLRNQIHGLKEELNMVDGIIKKQKIRSQFI